MSTITVRKKVYADMPLTSVKALGEGVYEGIVATSAEDRHGEVLDIKGLDTKAYMSTNPIVLFAHNYNDIFDVMGTCTSLKKTKDGQLVARWSMSKLNPKAMLADAMIKAKELNMLSIGFVPMEIEGNVYTKSEMVEFSIVPVPANAQAAITGRKLDLSVKEIGELLVKSHGEDAAADEGVATKAADNVSDDARALLVGLLADLAQIDAVVDAWQPKLAGFLGVANPDDEDVTDDEDYGTDDSGDEGEGQDAGEASNTVRGADPTENISVDLKSLDSITAFVGKLKSITGVLEVQQRQLSLETGKATVKKRVVHLVAAKEQVVTSVKQADRMVEAVLAELKNIN